MQYKVVHIGTDEVNSHSAIHIYVGLLMRHIPTYKVVQIDTGEVNSEIQSGPTYVLIQYIMVPHRYW